jgi:spermidine synthase
MLRAMGLRISIVIAALSGFVALSYEILWYRVLSFMTRGFAAAFGLLLAAYLLGLALGSRASAALCRDGQERGPMLRRLGALFAVANVVAALVVPVFAWSARFTDYRLGLGMVVLGAGFLGTVLPLVSHYGIDPDDRAGARLSYLYIANIVGSAAGSLFTGFVLMDVLSLGGLATALAIFGFVLAGAISVLARAPRFVIVYGIAAVVALGLVPRLHDRVYERLIYKREYDGTQRFDQIVENRSGVITVTDDGTVYGGGAYDGVLNIALENDDKNGIVRAYIAGALHPAPRDVLVIGLSGGAWAQVIAHVPGVERMTVVEINPGYIDVIKRHREVSGLLTNPKVDIVFDDGRRWLMRHPDRRFDLIVMNTTLHWRGHSTNLLSSDFMNIARKHLAPGGVFYFNTTRSLDVQLTAAHVFPHVLRISNFIAAADDPFNFDRERWRRMLETMTIEGTPVIDLGSERGRKLFDELAGYNDIAGRWAILEYYTPLAADVTDDNMRVEWRDPFQYPD